ncbi:MAG TPA: prepilin-type N-terminal cleavage/methylation domain-containing protein [Telluria sp.]|nr:prepilin-type N-terminal cleavage/methylation domain-containing protein [Telluria sp.]
MKARGFTLVELLVAISILAIVAVLGWRGLDGIVRARATLTQQMETTRGMQLAFAQMESDAEHLAVNRDLLQNRPYLVADNTRMALVRMVNADFEPARLQVVSYRIENGTLTRRESLATRDLSQIDLFWKAALSDNDPNPPVRLQTGVASMNVQIFLNGLWVVATPPSATIAPKGIIPGLQVSLQTDGVEKPMVKSFLLGGT